jgi:hypothetical protein
MWNKIIVLIIVLFFLGTRSSSLFAYQLSEEEVREIETRDNEICLARGHNLANEFSIKLYWDCRKQQIDERIIDAKDLKGRNKFYVSELKRIRQVVNNVLSRIESDFRDKLERYTGKEYHPIELRGKDFYYYNLLTFLNYNYSLLRVNTKDEMDSMMEIKNYSENKRMTDNIRENLEKYPECIKFDIKSDEFKECIEFKLRVEECKRIVLQKLNERDIDNKFDCKKQSIVKYPDYMVLYNSEYTELKNMKLDEFNIDRKRQEERERRMLELNRLMSGPRLSNIQLINLRKYEEKKCLMDKELENNLFKLTVSDECENMLKNDPSRVGG